MTDEASSTDENHSKAGESVVTLYRPAAREAAWRIEEAREREDVVTVFGRCTVDYEGRASSTLGPGDRLIVLKPDGTALVHTDEQRTPVNWQPPGCDHAVEATEHGLRVVSTRSSPNERLVVEFERVEHVAALAMTDEADLSLSGSEEDQRQRILDDPDLLEPGFDPVETERQSDAGAMDIYGEDGEGRPVVVELKRRRVGPNAVGQLKRYVEAVEREREDDREIRGILVAPSVTERAETLLAEAGLEHRSIAPTDDDEK